MSIAEERCIDILGALILLILGKTANLNIHERHYVVYFTTNCNKFLMIMLSLGPDHSMSIE